MDRNTDKAYVRDLNPPKHTVSVLCKWISAYFILRIAIAQSVSGVLFSAGARNFSLLHNVQAGTGTHLAFCTMATGGCFLGVKKPGREADHSTPFSPEVKKGGDILPLPLTSS
jgi:hypothetical protein